MSVTQGRDIAKPKAMTKLIADTEDPTNGGDIFRLATTPQHSVAKAIPYRMRKA